MRRFYTEQELITKSHALVQGQEAKHIRQTIRLGLDDKIELFDGSGSVYLSKIVLITKKKVEVEILETLSFKRSPPFLYVAQSLLKGKKMNLLYQKLTELSIEGLYPFSSQFSEIKTPTNKQLDRWKSISLEACKQCKRPNVMKCYPPLSFQNILTISEKFDNKIIFWEDEVEQFLPSTDYFKGDFSSTIILLGPEGGFSNLEITQAEENGFQTVSLGPRILRSETAAIVSASIIQYLVGNLNYTEKIEWEESQ